MSGALDGIRVIDFGQYLAAPLAAMILGDNGAEVIRVDPPGGPRWRNPANAVLQRGKLSIVLDLKNQRDSTVARQLVDSADVVIENFRPGVMKRFGLGRVEMTAANPRLIYCSIPGFGEDDPRANIAAWEGVVCAAAGIYDPPSFAGYVRKTEEPVFTALPLASNFAAFIASHSIVAALIARYRSGRGQWIEVPLYDAAFQAIGGSAQQVNGGGRPAPPVGINMAAINHYQCADERWVDISPPLRAFQWFADRFLPKEANESGIANVFRNDPEGMSKLRAVMTEVFKARTAAQWEQTVNQEARSSMALCQTTEEWLHDRHAIQSRCVISLNDPELGPTAQPGYPVALSKTPADVKGPRHLVDADHQIVIEKLAARAPGVSMRDSLDSGLKRPLDGFRAIDTSQILAGPTACRILAEYGAEIIKINNPRPDENPLATMAHLYVNNGKRTMLLDLKAPEGREILLRLVKTADVYHQNFVRDTAQRLGLGAVDIRKERPDIIYSSVSCHAYDGFRGSYRGHEELGQAVSGMQVRFGDNGEPSRAGWALCDYSTGHLSALGILLGLFHRLRTGEGQDVQAALSRSATFLQIPLIVDYKGRVWDEPRGQRSYGWGPLYRLYQASDRWFFLAAPDPGDIGRLAHLEGLGGIDRVPTEHLASEIAARFASNSAETWVSRIRDAGLGAHVLMNMRESITDPIAEKRGLSVLREHVGGGKVLNVGKSVRLSRTPLESLFPAPPLGSDSRSIVGEVGFGDRFHDLAAKGVVAGPT